MPTTQRGAFQAKPMKSRGQVDTSVISRDTSTSPLITMSGYLCGGMLVCKCFSRRASRETSNRTAHFGCCCYRESDRKSDLGRLVPCASGPLLPLVK